MPYDSNLDVQADVEKTQRYIADKLLLAFPSLGVETIVDFDADENGDLTGAFIAKENILYQFVIPAATGNPMIQRFAGVEQKESK
jgi:hypothetical protein